MEHIKIRNGVFHMDTITIVLIAIAFVCIIMLLIGNMIDNGLMQTIGLIGTVLGVLIAFCHNLIKFLSQFQ